jgi:hypothetical protein
MLELVSVTNIVYTRNPCTIPRRANTACPVVPDFSTVALALGRLICICVAVALDIVGTIGIKPVIFGPQVAYNHIRALCLILAIAASHQTASHVYLSVCVLYGRNRRC